MRKNGLRSRRVLFSPVRNLTTHAAETACEMTVAIAAPRTPMPNTKMNTGSSTTLSTAPISTVFIATLALPCAVINPLRPSAVITKIVPST